MRRRSHTADRSPRRGALLILVMVCLLAIATLAGTLLRLAVTQHRQSRVQQYQLQAEWLAISSLDRAEQQRAADPDWTSETWTPAVDFSGGKVQVDMRLEQSDSGPTELVATATWGDADLPKLRVTRSRRVATSATEVGGKP